MPSPPADSAQPDQRPCVHKFGGSSLANAARMARVSSILRDAGEPAQLIVVSALQGVTNVLVALSEATDDPATMLADLLLRHLALAAASADAALRDWLQRDFDACAMLLAQARGAGCSKALHARIHGRGEIWSARCLQSRLCHDGRDCALLDARDVLTVHRHEMGAQVDWTRSQAAWSAWRAQNPQPHVVVTGFIARDASGADITLGRNGSDYSAAIFAVLSNARELTLWGDTDGMLSADPRLVGEAVSLPQLSYTEACELAYFGARIIHPQTLLPAMQRALPIRIRNSFNPAHPGTRIDHDRSSATAVKGLSAMLGMALLNLEGAGMLGVPGTAERVFGALRAAGISVSMISQGSSEHSICCVIRDADGAQARAALLHAFAAEIGDGRIQGVTLTRDIGVIAAVGEGMIGQPGVAARLLSGIARAQVSVRAIAQGASERSISVAVGAGDTTRALRAAHAAFLLSGQTLSIGIIGPGQIGTALLEQLRAAQSRLRHEHAIDLRVRAIADSRRQWLDAGSEMPADWRARVQSGAATDLAAFAAHVHPGHLPHAVIIDCSASDALADAYAGWLQAGIHVITPSKRAASGPLERWQSIRTAAASSGAQLRYEASVGAGLPVIQTLRDLIDTGDTLRAIDGVLSGTLSWLFNHYDGSRPFSALLREAHARGYTEPDPRDDLAGMDVARKLVILAREAGLALDIEQVAVQSLVPEALMRIERDRFMARLDELDTDMAARLAQAQRRGTRLRYLATLDAQGTATVGLREIADTHAAAHLRATDNLLQFSTRRYCDNPLVVQGPGAGPEVTAAGVFADLLRVAGNLRRNP